MEKHIKKKMTKENSLQVNNVNRYENELIVIDCVLTAKVNINDSTYTCREYDLIQVSCTQAMLNFRLNYGSKYSGSVYEYSLLTYLVESYFLAYDELIMLVPPKFKWDVPQQCLH